MTYDNMKKAIFLSRLNRFVAEIEIDGNTEICHVKNTGRCRELLVPGSPCFVQHSSKPERKTAYDLITIYKGNRLINMDSQAPNKVFGEWLLKNGLHGHEITHLKPEYSYGQSRMDFFAETDKESCLIEVKGVTLEENGIARFPDAPTQRGIKHLHELSSALEKGLSAMAVFVVQMKGVELFRPNDITHPAFGQALREASELGVEILALDCLVSDTTLDIDSPVPIEL